VNSPVVTIRPQRDADGAGVRRVVLGAFVDQPVVADLEAALARNDRSYGYVADLAGSVVGHARLTWCWVDAELRLVDVLVLSPLSVATAAQRSGIGRQLVEHCISEADRMGSPMLLVEGDPAFYGRLGFDPAARLGVTRPSTRIPSAAMQAIALSSRSDWMHGALVYVDTFWEHDAVGLRAETLAEVRAELGD
jgi:putative acetyltransferase